MKIFDGLTDTTKSSTNAHHRLNQALRDDASFLLDRHRSSKNYHHRSSKTMCGAFADGEEKKEEELPLSSCGAFQYMRDLRVNMQKIAVLCTKTSLLHFILVYYPQLSVCFRCSIARKCFSYPEPMSWHDGGPLPFSESKHLSSESMALGPTYSGFFGLLRLRLSFAILLVLLASLRHPSP